MSGNALPAGQQIDVFLQPGEYFVGDAAHRIRTVLGSCVSVTLWNPRQRVGAMSHFMLATRGRPARRGAAMLDARYGDEALHLMLEELAARNVTAAECQAKIFGGGDMFPGRGASAAFAVGRRNGEAARALLEARGIELASESLYGEGHRQIMFDVSSGHVWSRQVEPAADVRRRTARG
jgi:chemotaxis protein CheD